MRVAACCFLCCILGAAPAHAERTAIVVGNNEARGLEDLRYAERDAERMAHLLRELGGVTRIRMLLGKDADALRHAIKEIVRARQKDTGVVIFYYSGHANENELLLGDTVFPFRELRLTLESISNGVSVAIVDACSSGRLARRKGANMVPTVSLHFPEGIDNRGYVFITSSAPSEASQESDEIQGSFFTHYLVSGLRGAADDSKDALVSLEEAYRYAYRRTIRHTSGTFSGPQHPEYDMNIHGRGELTLTNLALGKSYLVFPENTGGHFLIATRVDESIRSEVSKALGTRLRIALPPGEYQILQQGARSRFVGEVMIPSRGEAWFDPKTMREEPLRPAFASKGGARSANRFVMGYSAESPYLKDGELLQGVRLGYAHRLHAIRLGTELGVAQSSYRRADGLDVHALEVTGALLLEYAWFFREPWRLFAAAKVTASWIKQKGEFELGETEVLRNFAPGYGLRAGMGWNFVRSVALLAAAEVNQRILTKTASGTRWPITVGGVFGFEYSF